MAARHRTDQNVDDRWFQPRSGDQVEAACVQDLQPFVLPSSGANHYKRQFGSTRAKRSQGITPRPALELPIAKQGVARIFVLQAEHLRNIPHGYHRRDMLAKNLGHDVCLRLMVAQQKDFSGTGLLSPRNAALSDDLQCHAILFAPDNREWSTAGFNNRMQVDLRSEAPADSAVPRNTDRPAGTDLTGSLLCLGTVSIFGR